MEWYPPFRSFLSGFKLNFPGDINPAFTFNGRRRFQFSYQSIHVRLKLGEMASATVYNDDPPAQALAFERQGFEWLHVVYTVTSKVCMVMCLHCWPLACSIAPRKVLLSSRMRL